MKPFTHKMVFKSNMRLYLSLSLSLLDFVFLSSILYTIWIYIYLLCLCFEPHFETTEYFRFLFLLFNLKHIETTENETIHPRTHIHRVFFAYVTFLMAVMVRLLYIFNMFFLLFIFLFPFPNSPCNRYSVLNFQESMFQLQPHDFRLKFFIAYEHIV